MHLAARLVVRMTSFMRNLWADNTGPYPSIGWGGVFNFVNNIVYNWVHRTADGGEYSTMSNFINNYYKTRSSDAEGFHQPSYS